MLVDDSLGELIRCLGSLREDARALHLIAGTDRPDPANDNLIITRFAEACLDLGGWLQQAAAALVPVTPGPGTCRPEQIGRALVECLGSLDRAREVLDHALLDRGRLDDLQATCRARGEPWRSWATTAVTTAQRMVLAIESVRVPLRCALGALFDSNHLVTTTDAIHRARCGPAI